MADPRQRLREQIQLALGLSASEHDKLSSQIKIDVNDRIKLYPEECWKIYNDLCKQCLPTHVKLPQALYQKSWEIMTQYCVDLEMLPEFVIPVLFDINGRDHKFNPSPSLVTNDQASSFIYGNVEKKRDTMRGIVETYEHTAIYCTWALQGERLCRWMNRNDLFPAWVRILLLVKNDALDKSCLKLYREALSEWYRSETLQRELLERGYELV